VWWLLRLLLLLLVLLLVDMVDAGVMESSCRLRSFALRKDIL
jgi:hypothetical protein